MSIIQQMRLISTILHRATTTSPMPDSTTPKSKLAHWYEPLARLESRGSQVEPVGGLAGLAAAREQHLGQFFTPLEIVRFMWQVVGLADAGPPETSYGTRGHWQLFDGAFGSGRMFAFADPKLHALNGIEVDTDLAQQVIRTATVADFRCALHVGSMVDYTAIEDRSSYGYSSFRGKFHVGLINPPFSLHFDSPHVSKWHGLGSFGRFGAGSSTFSQKLAVAQALAWCEVVAAVVPRTFADNYVSEYRATRDRDRSRDQGRLRYVFHLPRSAFRSEGAEVETSVMVWGEDSTEQLGEHELRAIPDRPPHRLTLEFEPTYFRIGRVDAPKDEPAKIGRCDKLGRLIRAGKLDSPEGERTALLSHDGRKITVRCSDAATFGQAMNQLLGGWIHATEHRRADRAKTTGQGVFDIECLLAQPDPIAALDLTLAGLQDLGIVATASDSLRNYLRKRARQHLIDVTPWRHTALVEDAGFADWLAAQTSVRVVFKPDAVTASVHDHHVPGRTEPCTHCASWGESDKETSSCWRCKDTRIIDAQVRPQLCRIVTEGPITVSRSPRRESGRDKEDRSERHWNVDYEYDAGHEYDYDSADLQGVPKTRSASWQRWSEAELIERVTFPDFVPMPDGWTVVHEGLAAKFPQRYAAALARARRLGIDKWLWDYQLADLCEVSLKRGAVIAWKMGLGKARLAAALCLLGGGKHNLITVETRLIKEMETEFRAIGLPASEWQTITKPEQARDLRRINLISYDKLKSTLPGKKRKKPTEEQEAKRKEKNEKPRTHDVRHAFAALLRRRVHTHVCDEGHLLRAPSTQQSRAVHHVSAKGCRYLLTGTPIANYPRDVLWLLQWALGDGTAAQVFGNRWPLMRPENLFDYASAPRGVDEFRDRFVSLRWVTNEFADNMEDGAKREVPLIADVPGFRKVVAHVIKRRVTDEPEVARFVKIPVPTRVIESVEWDAGHFAYYHETAQTFIRWYQAEQERLAKERGEDKDAKAVRMIAILQNLIAVYQAANYPQGGVGGQPEWDGGDTSKQRRAVDIAAQWVGEGHKVITYSRSPRLATHLAVRLRARDIDVVEFHGGIPVSKRVDALDKRFRDGKAQVLAATKGCLQTGYNLACASRVLHVDGEWTPSVVQQADARVLRPQQRRDVEIRYLDLRGSIDDYQRQMVEQKGLTMSAGLDYGAGPGPDAEFKHLDHILGQFISDFAELKAPA
jgi:hypothetical protein